MSAGFFAVGGTCLRGVKISEKALHWCCVCGIIIYVCNTIGNDRYLHAGCVKMQRVVNCKKERTNADVQKQAKPA